MNHTRTLHSFRRRAVSASGLLAALSAMSAAPAHAQEPNTIGTVAGGGTQNPGDNGPATSAMLDLPSGIVTDRDGNILFADSNHHRIRRVAPDGTITTLVGNGTAGPGGDGGPAISAQLNYPSGLALAANGDLYISDTKNHRIRRVDASGTIATVVGTGTEDSTTEGSNGDDGPALNAELDNPAGIALDNTGQLFIAETGSHRIRRVSASGTITTIAGNGTKGFSGDNNLATGAQLNSPSTVAVDNQGNVYFSDSLNMRVRRVDPSAVITTVAGSGQPFGPMGDNGPATSASLLVPGGVLFDNGNLYITEALRNVVRKVDAAGVITTVAGNGRGGFSGDGGPATSAQLNTPVGLALDASGHLLITDGGNDRVRRVFIGAPQPTPGDLDGNQAINIRDATLSLIIAVGLQTPTGNQRAAADVNFDGVVDLKDVTIILRRAVGL